MRFQEIIDIIRKIVKPNPPQDEPRDEETKEGEISETSQIPDSSMNSQINEPIEDSAVEDFLYQYSPMITDLSEITSSSSSSSSSNTSSNSSSSSGSNSENDDDEERKENSSASLSSF